MSEPQSNPREGKRGHRLADYSVISAERRAAIKAEAAGNAKLEKALLQSERRRVAAEREHEELLLLGGPRRMAQVGEQFTFEDRSFEAEIADRPRREEMIYRAQTDLMFLAVELLGYNFTERTHRPVIDFMVHKNPDRPAIEWDTYRRRCLMDPRNCYKSTLVAADATQVTINDVEQRICFLGGEGKLAKGALDKYQAHFIVRDPPTRFQRLFPEFCIKANQKYSEFFNAPNRRNPDNHREHGAMYFSMEAAVSGWHFEWMYLDDVVNNENSKTFDRLTSIRSNFHTNVKMLEKPPRAGYLIDVGTRYDPNDLHGELLASDSVKKFVRRAIWAKDGPSAAQLEKALRDPNVTAKDLNPSDFELLFPERLSFAELMEERGTSLESFYSFCAQYLNDPVAAGGEATFSLEEMRRATIPFNQIPRNGGQVGVMWDIAYSTKQGRDFTVAPVFLIDLQGRMWVLEIIRGRFVTHDLVCRIVDAIRRWNPEWVDIEDSLGVKFLLSDLERKAQETGVPLRVNWVPIDNSPKPKDGRVKYLESLLHEGRLFFANTIECMDDLYREFCGYGKEDHDDIPDSIGLAAVHHVPKIPPASFGAVESQGVYQNLYELDLHDRIHGLGGYAPEPPPEPAAAPDPYELEPVLGGLNG